MKQTTFHFPFPLKKILPEFAASLVKILKEIHLRKCSGKEYQHNSWPSDFREKREKTNMN
jgi:hypothetical protein